MKDLNDLLDNTFGSNQKPKVQRKTSVKQPNTRKQPRNKYIPNQADKNDLIEALGYAINAIKKKYEVVHKVKDSAYLNHFLRWNAIREKLKK